MERVATHTPERLWTIPHKKSGMPVPLRTHPFPPEVLRSVCTAKNEYRLQAVVEMPLSVLLEGIGKVCDHLSATLTGLNLLDDIEYRVCGYYSDPAKGDGVYLFVDADAFATLEATDGTTTGTRE